MANFIFVAFPLFSREPNMVTKMEKSETLIVERKSSLHSDRREFHWNPTCKDRPFPLRLLATQSWSFPLSPPTRRDDNGFFVTTSGTMPCVIELTFFDGMDAAHDRWVTISHQWTDDWDTWVWEWYFSNFV